MELKSSVSEFLSQDDLYNINNKNFKGRLFMYYDIIEDRRKNYYNLYYYNEEEKNKTSESSVKLSNPKSKISLFYGKNKSKDEKNNNFQKKKKLINFVEKNDKNKNLRINDIDNLNNIYKDLFLNINKEKNSYNNKYKKNNNLIKSRNLSANVLSKFNINKLTNINTNIIKIVSQKVIELPRPQICYFTRAFISGEDFSFLKQLQIPKNDKCHNILKDNNTFLPRKNICYFNKIFIALKHKYESPVINKRYFCTKIIKNNHKEEGRGKKKSKKGHIISKNKSLSDLINNRKTTKKSNTINKNKNKNKIKSKHNIKTKLTYNQLKVSKAINHENVDFPKVKFKNNFLEKNINLNKDEVKEIKKPKSPIYKARKKTSNLPYLIYEKKDASDTSSSIDGDKKNSTLFNHLLNKKESVNKIFGIKHSRNKVTLHRYIPNGKDFMTANDKFIIPKIIEKSSKNKNLKSPKSPISSNIISSKDLIKKIKFDFSLNNNKTKNNIINIKKQNSCDSLSDNLMDYKSNKPKISNIKSPQFYMNNNILNKLYNDFEMVPSQIKNENNRYDKNDIFAAFKRKNKSIAIRKINFSKNSNDKIKNYKNDVLAIKSYFNIK